MHTPLISFLFVFLAFFQTHIQDQQINGKLAHIPPTYLELICQLITMPQANIDDQQIIMEYAHTTY